jgi:hypothetical protein
MKSIATFMGSANEILPLTYEAGHQHDMTLLESGRKGDRDQMVRIAAARTGLEVAQAWMNRINGLDWEAGCVFLGGSCNPTTWRMDTAMPMLTDASVPFYNPQVEEWSEELVEIEARAKEDAAVLLFVIGKETRALASVAEAAEYICRGRNIVLVIEEVPQDMSFDGVGTSKAELKDLNRSRSYLRDICTRHAATCLDTVEQAVQYIINNYQSAKANKLIKRTRIEAAGATRSPASSPTGARVVPDESNGEAPCQPLPRPHQTVDDVAADVAKDVVAAGAGGGQLIPPMLRQGDYNSESMRMVRTTKPLLKPRARQ